MLRVKRKRTAEPAEALVLACKRLRSGDVDSAAQNTPESLERAAENNVFQLVATVRSQVLGGDGICVEGILGRCRGNRISNPLLTPPYLPLLLSRRSQSSSLCGLPCVLPGAASSVSAAISALQLAMCRKKAATGWSPAADPPGPPVARSPSTRQESQKLLGTQTFSYWTWYMRRKTQRLTPRTPSK